MTCFVRLRAHSKSLICFYLQEWPLILSFVCPLAKEKFWPTTFWLDFLFFFFLFNYYFLLSHSSGSGQKALSNKIYSTTCTSN